MAVDITLPALSPTMESGKIIEWHKKVGDKIISGDLLFEVETDKAIMEVTSADEGILACILHEKDAVVNVNEVVAVLANNNEDLEEIAKGKSQNKKMLKEEKKNVDKYTEINQAYKPQDSLLKMQEFNEQSDRVLNQNIKKISPRAVMTAMQHDISRDEALSVLGSGQDGRIIQKDLMKHIENAHVNNNSTCNIENVDESTKTQIVNKDLKGENGKKVLTNDFRITSYQKINESAIRQPASHIRKAIAKNLVHSVQTIPTFFVQTDCVIDNAIEFVKKAREITGVKVTLNDLIVKACAFASFQCPKFNSSWNDEDIIIHNTIDIGVAISIDDGVVVRNIKNVVNKSVTEISLQLKEVIAESREKKLHENYIFAISNIGISEIDMFAATLSGTAILAVGASKKKPIVVNNQIVICNVVQVTITCDHRILDGKDAAHWVRFFKIGLSDPSSMLY
ncbi:dihydrolipoamide acetyltransferase family protein [Candidatus Gromoviella agglomerans]|uniref:dihydrolipoamide acetyltransferase family protein n=1 Tax=Candidatus Gromoviella agglomerans TaxID=2806609 RepID=UPI001E3DA33B|nr:dihydrolipoamide acetyltransferase family protein [Candidatus Gromoviella agglomerans]UFX98195.1 Dihydrolipoyllysine-residue acetyltransferase component of pyruvate dehydrogenase complex [Candidatus Gromoviella agglomerans]